MPQPSLIPKEAGNDVWGQQRLALACVVRDILKQGNATWFVENGTLLGAWRNGGLIANDDDFDIAVLYQAIYTKENQILPYQAEVFEMLQRLLPTPFQVRSVSSYATKLEVFDPTHGHYYLAGPGYFGANFHYVTVDLQAYGLCPIHRSRHFKSLYRQQTVTRLFTDVFPLSSTLICEQSFPAPKNIEQVLLHQYGCLLPGANFNETTGLYDDQPIK